MALPERRESPAPQIHVDDMGDQRQAERTAPHGWRWWWVWGVIIGLAVWWAGWGWAGTGGWWFGRSSLSSTVIPAPAGKRTTETLANAGAKQPARSATLGTSTQPMAGPGVKILNSADKQTFDGRQFAANDVPVQKKVSDHVLWIGAGAPMLAVMTGKFTGDPARLGKGKIVDALGTVEKAPSEAQAKREWKLSSQGASRLEHEGAYISVSQLTIPPQ